MKTIVEGIAVEYLDEGAGPTILLLHGWGNSMRYFDSLCAELPHYRKVRLDLPGFGQSDMPREPWTVERYARFVVSFCEKVSAVPDVIVGHSFGGRILTKGLSLHILTPERAVLIASAGVAHRRTFRNVLYAVLAKIGKMILYPLPRQSFARIKRMFYAYTGSDYLTVGGMSETFLNMIREDLSADARAICTPTLIVWGENDPITPLSEGETLSRLIPHSRLMVIPHAGHFVYRDNPKEVARLIAEFV